MTFTCSQTFFRHIKDLHSIGDGLELKLRRSYSVITLTILEPNIFDDLIEEVHKNI